MSSHVVIHIPHSSTRIPVGQRDAIVLSDAELDRELLRMTDHFTDELFACEGLEASRIRYSVSRLVVDPERFESDEHEPMSTRGMGVIYTKTADGGALRRPPTREEREHLLATLYRPHHEVLTKAVVSRLEEHGRCLIIDGHSFPGQPNPYELDQDPDRADYCIGTDAFHTPPELTQRLLDSFQQNGRTVAVNRPFAGSIVPMAFYRKDAAVTSVMIEVNRRLYMDEETGDRLPEFASIREEVCRAVQSVALLI